MDKSFLIEKRVRYCITSLKGSLETEARGGWPCVSPFVGSPRQADLPAAGRCRHDGCFCTRRQGECEGDF